MWEMVTTIEKLGPFGGGGAKRGEAWIACGGWGGGRERHRGRW